MTVFRTTVLVWRHVQINVYRVAPCLRVLSVNMDIMDPQDCLECDKITGVCSKCGSGFYWSGSLCLQCTIGCTECTNSGISSCSACSPGYYLDTSTCIKCPDGCISCAWSDKCNECIDGYFKVSNSGRCEKCLSSCKSCASAAQCTACVDGYYGCHYGCLFGFTGRTCSESKYQNVNTSV